MKSFTSFFSNWAHRIPVPGLAVFLALGLQVYSPGPAQAQQGVAPTILPAGGCAIDGNLLSRVPVTAPFSSSNGDFLPNEGAPGTGGYVFTLAGIPVDTATSYHLIDGYDAADASIFTGGSKFNNNPNTWKWKTGKPTAKDDINNSLFFFSSDVSGNLWFIGSGDRKNTNGNTYLDFELLQNSLYKNPGGTFTSLGPNGGRTIGDLAVTIIYTNGGSNPQLVIHQWSSTGQGTFGYVQVTPAAGTTFLATNKDSAIVVPYGAFGVNTYPVSAFTEVACNLNDLVPGSATCLNIKTVIVKTKASQSVSAELKDFINPIQINIGSAPVISVNSPTFCAGDSAILTATVISGAGPFTYLWSTGETTESITVSPDTTTQYTVVVTGGNGCPSNPATSTVTVLPVPVAEITGVDSLCPGDTTTLTASVLSGTGPFTYLWNTSDTTQSITVSPAATTLYTVVVTGLNGCPSIPDSLTVTILPEPVCSISGSDSICPSGSGQFSAPDSLSSYAWTITGNGTIQGSSSDQIVEVQGTGGCDSSFVLTLVVTNSGGCSSTCSKTVSLLDHISPVISDVPGPLTVLCASQVPPSTSDTVTVTDNCVGDITLLVTDSVTGMTCPNHFTVIRTWTATDPCGNQSTALQTITVSDTLPPQLEGIPADTGVCCADSIPLPAAVTAFDSCDGQLAVEFSEAVSDSSGPNMFILTRTWTATDSCGNIATDEQVITVNDTLFSSQFPLSINSPDGNGILRFTVSPNPFISTTNIQFSLTETGHASVVLYNSMGVKVKSIFDGEVTGALNVTLKLSPDASMGTGMYLLVLRTNHGYATRQIILTR